MEIQVYEPPEAGSPEFRRIAITHKANEISMEEKFHSFGRFSITIPTKYSNGFRKWNLLLIDRYYWGLVMSVSFRVQGGSDMLTATGIQLKGLTASRNTVSPGFSGHEGTQGYDAVTGSTETVMKHIMRSNFFSSGSPTRSLDGLIIAPDLGRGLPDDKYMTRDERLSEVLQKLGEASGLGYDIIPDVEHGVLTFDAVEGIDRSAAQRDRPAVIFSPGLGTVESMEYTSDDSEMRNVFYATRSGYEFMDEAYTAVYTRDDELPAGIRRWEQPLSISVNTPEAGKEYEEMQRLARIAMEDYTGAESFSCSIREGTRYREDYFLGDIVTVRNEEWGVEMHARVVSIKTSGSGSGIKRTAEFGKSPLSLNDKIRCYIKNAR